MLEERPLVSPEWLRSSFGCVKIIDASWRMPGQPPAKLDYAQRHIEGAVFFDIDEIADRETDLPHMLPSAADFEKAVGEMGISNADPVVVYDDAGIFSAPRVWWTFRAMGHRNVAVLDGGLKGWIDAGGDVTDVPPDVLPTDYRAAPDPDAVSTHEDIRAAATRSGPAIVDARPPDRFSGAAAEPRPGLVAGAMPGAKNLPQASLVTADGAMKTAEALRALFIAAGVDPDQPLIATCGSGVTAASIALAAEALGRQRWSVYDGSWAEWGKETHDRVAYPVVVKSQ